MMPKDTPLPRTLSAIGQRLALTLMLLTAVALAGGLAGPAVAAPTIGQPAPGFTIVTAAGETRSLADYAGKVVVLEWTNHDCPYVRKHYGSGNMQALQQRAADAGVVWLTVISSAPGEQGYVQGAEAQRIAREAGAKPRDILLDPEGIMGRAYGAKTTPHMYVIDPGGRLVYMGGIDDRPTTDPDDIKGAKNYVSAALGDISADRPVGMPSTRAYGCSVKYRS